MNSDKKIVDSLFETKKEALNYVRTQYPNYTKSDRSIFEYCLTSEVFWDVKDYETFEASFEKGTDLIMVNSYEGGKTSVKIYRTYISMMVLAAEIGDINLFTSKFNNQLNHIAKSLSKAMENKNQEIVSYLMDHHYEEVKEMYGGLVRLAIECDAVNILKELVKRKINFPANYLAVAINRNSLEAAKFLCLEQKVHLDEAFPDPNTDWFNFKLRNEQNDVTEFLKQHNIIKAIQDFWNS